MVYITGDMHGDLARIKDKRLKKLKKGDTLIVCGDFGFIWNGSKKEQKLLRWIGKRRYNFLFLDGVYENFELLRQYPQEEWGGGLVRRISGNLRYLERGEIYTIEHKTFFCFGGGDDYTVDLNENAQVAAGSLPSEQQLQRARHNLAERGNTVDYILTHECPAQVYAFVDMDTTIVSGLRKMFDEFAAKVQYTCWLFGSLHLDRRITPKFSAVYKEIYPLK